MDGRRLAHALPPGHGQGPSTDSQRCRGLDDPDTDDYRETTADRNTRAAASAGATSCRWPAEPHRIRELPLALGPSSPRLPRKSARPHSRHRRRSRHRPGSPRRLRSPRRPGSRHRPWCRRRRELRRRPRFRVRDRLRHGRRPAPELDRGTAGARELLQGSRQSVKIPPAWHRRPGQSPWRMAV
jgi:hypothetical protein